MNQNDESSSDDDFAIAQRKRRLMSARKEKLTDTLHGASTLPVSSTDQEPEIQDVEIAVPPFEHRDVMPEEEMFQVMTLS
jgi:hypothetical protein